MSFGTNLVGKSVPNFLHHILSSYHRNLRSHFLKSYHKMSLIKFAWCVSSMKNMHPGSPSDPSWTAAQRDKAKLHILDFKNSWSEFQKPDQTTAERAIQKPHVQRFRNCCSRQHSITSPCGFRIKYT